MEVIAGLCFVLLIFVLVSRGSGKRHIPARPVALDPVSPAPKVTPHPLIWTELPHGYQQNEQDEEFEERIAKTFGEGIDKQFYSRVAGVTFANEDGVCRESLVDQCEEFDKVLLVREPENPHGSTAIRVMNAAGAKLGYLPHETAAELSWEIDRSHREWLGVVRHAYKHQVDGHSAMVIFLMRVKTADVDTESSRFEAQFKKTVGDCFDMHFHAQMDRAFGANEDGSDRQELIAKCEPLQAISLHREQQNEHDLNSVSVANSDGQRLGYLTRRIAAEVAPQIDAGRSWAAVVQRTEPTPTGRRMKLHLCIYRVAVERR